MTAPKNLHDLLDAAWNAGVELNIEIDAENDDKGEAFLNILGAHNVIDPYEDSDRATPFPRFAWALDTPGSYSRMLTVYASRSLLQTVSERPVNPDLVRDPADWRDLLSN